MRTVETILQEIIDLKGQDNKAAFEKFLEAAAIGRDSGNKLFHVMGMLNAAAVSLHAVDSKEEMELMAINCMELITAARDVDEAIWTKYLEEEPHMHEMMKTLSNAGALNN